VRFDASIATELGWRFAPAQRSVDIRLGETVVSNMWRKSDRAPTQGTAVFNVTPEAGRAYFKIGECFCFTAQDWPQEAAMLPVLFFDQPWLTILFWTTIHTITCPITFYPANRPGRRWLNQGRWLGTMKQPSAGIREIEAQALPGRSSLTEEDGWLAKHHDYHLVDRAMAGRWRCLR
jgi:hypothetical protein